MGARREDGAAQFAVSTRCAHRRMIAPLPANDGGTEYPSHKDVDGEEASTPRNHSERSTYK